MGYPEHWMIVGDDEGGSKGLQAPYSISQLQPGCLHPLLQDARSSMQSASLSQARHALDENSALQSEMGVPWQLGVDGGAAGQEPK